MTERNAIKTEYFSVSVDFHWWNEYPVVEHDETLTIEFTSAEAASIFYDKAVKDVQETNVTVFKDIMLGKRNMPSQGDGFIRNVGPVVRHVKVEYTEEIYPLWKPA